MIFGSYPCCDEPLMIAVPETTPAYAKEKCPGCGTMVWHRLSRWDPESWTEEEFLRLHDVDEDKKVITPKLAAPNTAPSSAPPR